MDSKSIFQAITEGNLHIIQQAIEAGIELNMQDENGNTLLMVAVASQQTEIAEYLISLNPDFYIYNDDELTVFPMAEQLEDRTIYNSLVNHSLKPEEEIYLIGHHCVPRGKQEDGTIGAYINCYVVSTDYETAFARCQEMIDVDGWDILELEYELVIDWSEIEDDDEDLEFIEQAIIDKEVMLIFAYSNEDERNTIAGI